MATRPDKTQMTASIQSKIFRDLAFFQYTIMCITVLSSCEARNSPTLSSPTKKLHFILDPNNLCFSEQRLQSVLFVF